MSDCDQLKHVIQTVATALRINVSPVESRIPQYHSERQVTPESLEDDAKTQMKQVKAAGHKDIRWCGAYKVRALSDISVTLRSNGIAGISEMYLLKFRMRRLFVNHRS